MTSLLILLITTEFMYIFLLFARLSIVNEYTTKKEFILDLVIPFRLWIRQIPTVCSNLYNKYKSLK